MDFSDALRHTRDGKVVTRKLWGEHPGKYPVTAMRLLPMASPGFDGDVMPQLMIVSLDGVLRPFGGAQWDLLADDWEVVS